MNQAYQSFKDGKKRCTTQMFLFLHTYLPENSGFDINQAEQSFKDGKKRCTTQMFLFLHK